jgi:hypothetical protein
VVQAAGQKAKRLVLQSCCIKGVSLNLVEGEKKISQLKNLILTRYLYTVKPVYKGHSSSEPENVCNQCLHVAITNKVVSLNPVHGELYSIQHYVIKFVSDLRQVCGFLGVPRFPPPVKVTTTIYM